MFIQFSKKTFFLLLFISFLFYSTSTAAETQKRPVEFFAFFNLHLGSFDSTYPNTYPIHINSSASNSSASQELNIQSRPGAGVTTGFIIPVSKMFSLKISVDYSRSLLKGENSPVMTHLEYTALFPPDYQPQLITSDRSRNWPATQGKLKTLAFSINLQYAVLRSKKFNASLSAGTGYYWTYGNFYPLSYSDYWMGGHSVLFSDSYLVFLKIPVSGKIGFNADFEIAYRISKRLSLAARGAYNLCTASSVMPQIDSALYFDSLSQVTNSHFLEIKSQMNFSPLEIKLSYLSLNFGIRCSLPF